VASAKVRFINALNNNSNNNNNDCIVLTVNRSKRYFTKHAETNIIVCTKFSNNFQFSVFSER